MSVQRFRSVEDMRDAPLYAPGSRELARAISRVWKFANKTCPQRFPPGVYRHRSYVDAEAFAAAWERANFTAHQQRKRIVK